MAKRRRSRADSQALDTQDEAEAMEFFTPEPEDDCAAADSGSTAAVQPAPAAASHRESPPAAAADSNGHAHQSDSHGTPNGEQTDTAAGQGQATEHNSPQINTGPERGDDNADPPAGCNGTDAPRESADQVRSRVWGRFVRERRDLTAMGLQRNEMMRLARSTIRDKEERQAWVYGELDRLYPPLHGPAKQADLAGSTETTQSNSVHVSHTPISDHQIRTYVDTVDVSPQLPTKNVPVAHSSPSATDGQIQGLSSLPEGWPTLPANASLAAEIGWVQANRLRCVTERLGGATVVRLDLALSHAPSWAALGWLETSIRSYAKFVDVASKATGGDDDEAAVMRHERRSLAEVERILDEMRAPAGN